MKKKIIFTWILASLLTGCGNFLSEYSQDMVIPKTVSDLDEVLIGEVYMPSTIRQHGMSSAVCGFFNVLDDDINTVATSLSGNVGTPSYAYSVGSLFGYFAWQQDVRYNYSRTSYSDDNATWDNLYRRINIANIILTEIEDLPHETDRDYAAYLRVKGETHFLRGQFYFILANLYGDAYAPSTCADKLCVPLKLTPYVEYDKDAVTMFSRATVEQVYAQIVSDLSEAERYLTESPQKEKHRLHRATWEAVDVLLSRVYLYMQDWENAEKLSAKVMASPDFSLATLASLTGGGAFLTESNPDVIFSQGSNNLTPPDLSWSVYAVPSDYCVSRDLYDLYAEEDARKSCFFTVNTLTDSIALSNKYQRGITQHHVSDAMTMRMSEAYLNYAEACAMQPGKEAEANRVLNQFRAQRIKSHTARTYAGEELVNEVREERRKEMCFEGKRWFDLRRFAVCERYPFSRDIIHAFCIYSDNFKYVSTEYYKLPAGDPAYTFGIPRKVLEFDKIPMPDNPREERAPLDADDTL